VQIDEFMEGAFAQPGDSERPDEAVISRYYARELSLPVTLGSLRKNQYPQQSPYWGTPGKGVSGESVN